MNLLGLTYVVDHMHNNNYYYSAVNILTENFPGDYPIASQIASSISSNHENSDLL